MWEAGDSGSTGAMEERIGKFRRRWSDWEIQQGRKRIRSFA